MTDPSPKRRMIQERIQRNRCRECGAVVESNPCYVCGAPERDRRDADVDRTPADSVSCGTLHEVSRGDGEEAA